MINILNFNQFNENYGDKLIQISKIELENICNLLNIKDTPKFLSSGSFGNAYKIGDKVLKITTDKREAKTIDNINRDNKSIVKIYSINQYKLKNKFIYVIVMDYVENISDYIKKYKNINNIKSYIEDLCTIISYEDINNIDDIENYLIKYGWSGKSDFWIKRFFTLYQNKEKNQDLHIDNLGIKNGELLMFDINDLNNINKYNQPKILK